MVKQSVEQNGQLSQNPLAELIREAAATGLSGAFRLAQEQIKSVLYFDAGDLLFVVSNVRSHRLAEVARKWNFVTQQQLSDVGAQSSDANLGAALVASGALTADALAELMSRQASSVLRPMLMWVEGTWSFDPRVRLAEDVRVEFSLRELFIESARRLPPDYVFMRFGNTNEVLTLVADPPMDVALQPAEAFMLSRIDPNGIHLHELLTISGLPETETFCAIYPLALGGFLDRDRWPRAFTDNTVNRFKAVDAAVRKAATESTPISQPATDEAVASAPPASKEPAEATSDKEEIDKFFFRVEAAEDFYEVLAVPQSADAATIKRTYHALARRFHPDRFHQEAGTSLHARLQTTFARVAQAYEMLKDSNLRASYNLRLQNERKMRSSRSFTPTATTAPITQPSTVTTGGGNSTNTGTPSSTGARQIAEDSFQKGMAAFKAGNFPHAVAYLGEAAKRVPNEARYRANFGRALAVDSKTRHQAEKELKAAIELDGNNASYRVMLAQLYSEIGMRRRAQGEAQRALVIEPHNEEALRLLQDLGNLE